MCPVIQPVFVSIAFQLVALRHRRTDWAGAGAGFLGLPVELASAMTSCQALPWASASLQWFAIAFRRLIEVEQKCDRSPFGRFGATRLAGLGGWPPVSSRGCGARQATCRVVKRPEADYCRARPQR